MMIEAIEGATKNQGSRYRILVVCNDGDYFLRHRLPVVTHLSSRGVDVTVIAGGHPIPADRIRGWNYIHVQIERFGFDPISDFRLMVRTARAIWFLRPDAVHLITLKPAMFSAFVSVISRFFYGYPKRILITLPGLGRMLSLPKAPGERRYPVGTALTLLAFRILARHDHVHFTFETKHDRDFWTSKGVANDNNSTIVDGAGVDPKLFYPSEIPRNNSKIKVVFASRLLKSKGLSAVLITARDLSQRTDVQFIVAGMSDKQDPDAISPEHLKRLDEINFLGNVDDMPGLLRECDIVCLPTRYGEGIPRILIEAAASGLASIVSSHPGCLEVVEDGVTGQILHASTDTEMSREMAAAVIKYLESPEFLKIHKANAYRHFLSRKFAQDAIDGRFAELLGVHSKSPSPD